MDYSYAFSESVSGLASSLVSSLSSSGASIVFYIFTGLALSAIARRREIRKSWLAWIPGVNGWILGSISDQYRYVVHGQVCSKRKILLVLSILELALSAVMLSGVFALVFDLVEAVISGTGEQEILRRLLSSLSGYGWMLLPAVSVSIAHQVVRFMALYDVYASCEPRRKGLFLALSILVDPGIFLFICRNRDKGMPPRRGPRPILPDSPEEGPVRPPVYREPPEYL